MTDEKGEPQPAPKNADEGNNDKGLGIVERAREERERLEKENERLEKNLKELRELEAARLLGGTGGGHIEASAKTIEQRKSDELAKEMVSAFK